MNPVTPAISGAWRQCVSDTTRPHAGQFEALTVEAEQAFDQAARRLELIGQCRRWINVDPRLPVGSAVAHDYVVTPGGLTFKEAALQCLQGGCVESLEEISRRAARHREVEYLYRELGGE